MTGPWQPEEFEDTYTAQVEQLILDKSQGRQSEAAQPPPKPTDVVDLTEALRRSVDQARGGGSRRPRSDREDLSGLSKSELDGLARDLRVRGRSKMSRSDLESAVAEARGSRGKKTRKAS
jgi:DNA end-binding protein Ku